MNHEIHPPINYRDMLIDFMTRVMDTEGLNYAEGLIPFDIRSPEDAAYRLCFMDAKAIYEIKKEESKARLFMELKKVGI